MLYPHQIQAIASLREAFRAGKRKLLLVSPTGCHERGQLLMTFDGVSRPVEDFQVGDQLMGPDSRPRTVLYLCRGRGNMFRVIPVKGTPFVVNEDHVLTLVRSDTGIIIDVSVREWLGWSKTAKHIHKLMRASVDFAEKPQPLIIDPYFLGVLLGDGSMRHCVGVCKPDPEIRKCVEEQAIKFKLRVRADGLDSSTSTTYYLVSNGEKNPLIKNLRDLGLYGCNSSTKYIPVRYKTAKHSERLELLAGLMDTDGSLSRNCYDFISKSEQLSNDVAFVARSLGLAAYVSSCEKYAQTGNGGIYFRVSISGETSIIPCRIPRKKASPRQQKKCARHTGFSIEPIGEGDFHGFILNGDGRYLMDDFTVTHNSGKTVVAVSMIENFLKKTTGQVVFIVHRDCLAAQAAETLRAIGVTSSIFMGDHEHNPASRVQICGIQTLARRQKADKWIPTPELVIYDECHHANSTSSRRILDLWKNIPLIGLTATPIRSDGQCLGDIFDHLIVAATTRQLIEKGDLVPYKARGFIPPDLSRLHRRAGEFKAEEVDVIVNVETERKIIVDKYEQYARNQQAIVFPASCEHSKKLIEIFQARGYRAAHLDWETTDEERTQMLADFREKRLQVLSSVGVLTEGFDAPSAEVAILARPTASLGLLIQMIGRVLRTSPGKQLATIHDHYANLIRLGLPDSDIAWSLTKTPEIKLAALTCTECYAIVTAWTPEGNCPECGALQHAPQSNSPARKKRKKPGIDDVDCIDTEQIREMHEKLNCDKIQQRFDKINEELISHGKRPIQRTSIEIEKIRHSTQEDQAREFLRLRQLQREKGYKNKYSYIVYRLTFGTWPKFDQQYLDSLSPAIRPFLSLAAVFVLLTLAIMLLA